MKSSDRNKNVLYFFIYTYPCTEFLYSFEQFQTDFSFLKKSKILVFQYRRELFYVPLMYIIKSLTSMNDHCIMEHMIRCRPDDHFWEGKIHHWINNCLYHCYINAILYSIFFYFVSFLTMFINVKLE